MGRTVGVCNHSYCKYARPKTRKESEEKGELAKRDAEFKLKVEEAAQARAEEAPAPAPAPAPRPAPAATASAAAAATAAAAAAGPRQSSAQQAVQLEKLKVSIFSYSPIGPTIGPIAPIAPTLLSHSLLTTGQ